MKKHILIVEDENDIASALSARLRTEGYAVSVADNGIDGLDLALDEPYELAILDIMLPGIDGLAIAEKLRAAKDTAILVLSARGEEEDVVSGLAIGADDYVTKPFSAREVVARVNALLRRREANLNVSASAQGVLNFGELVIDGMSHAVKLEGNFVHTTPTEFRLLNVLCSRPGIVFTREELIELLTQIEDSEVTSNELASHSNLRTVDSHIRSLRKKIGANYIRTIHAVGYSFENQISNSKESA